MKKNIGRIQDDNNIDIKEKSKEFYCKNCSTYIIEQELEINFNVCKKCGYHFKIDSNKRVELIFDEGSIQYFDTEMVGKDVINFPGYSEKLLNQIEELGMSSAVITGFGSILENRVCFGIMDYRFIMGSMGSVEGEKITRMIERATINKMPIILFSASGGARIHEGMLAVYQMAKVSAAIKKHSNEELLFISVLTDPTLGGVNASFASVGDIIIAEPNATIGFAGRRVVEQTINEKLIDEFQTAEFMLEHGFIDCIIDRRNQKQFLSDLLKFHKYEHKVSKDIDIIKCKNKVSNDNTISPWQRIRIARNSKRPRFKEYINGMINNFIEIHGDMLFKDDKAMVCGLGYLEDLPVTVILNAKGREINENIERNFGMAHPEGYRKALRVMKQAEKFNRPILCLIDTPGAFCGVEAEKRGQAKAIATCLMEMTDINVPIITLIHGEGGSGGALATSVGDYTYMLENSFFSVISPEGAAAIILKDSKRAEEISKYLKLTSYDLLEFGIIDEIIKEPKMGLHNDMDETISELRSKIYKKFRDLLNQDKEQLMEKRYMKIRTVGSEK